jgi:DDE superfamily endonuclease
LAYCPRSSLPAKVLAWLAGRLAHLTPPRPPGQGGTPPLPLELRLDAVAAVLLDGLSYRRAGRMVGISKTEVGDSLDLLLPKLAALGYCQPDGSFVTTLGDVRERLVEMAEVSEVVCVDGLATRVQRPRGWGNQKVLYDAKRHAHTAQGLAVSTIHGDLLWCDGGWPGGSHEQELLELSGLGEVLAASGDRASGQRRGAAPLAGAAVPGARCLPRRWRAGLPGPVAAPGTRMNEHHGHPR